MRNILLLFLVGICLLPAAAQAEDPQGEALRPRRPLAARTVVSYRRTHLRCLPRTGRSRRPPLQAQGRRLLEALEAGKLQRACRVVRRAAHFPGGVEALQRALFSHLPSPSLLREVGLLLHASPWQCVAGRDTLLRVLGEH